MVLVAPGVPERDRSYAIAMITRLRRLPGVPGDRVTVVLETGDGTPVRVLARFEGGAARKAHHASGRTFLEALDRLESAVRRSIA